MPESEKYISYAAAKWHLYHEFITNKEAAKKAFRALSAIPAADVRPVVRCRDCLHYEMGVCLKIYDDGAANKDAWQERKPDDFCSYGGKREEN